MRVIGVAAAMTLLPAVSFADAYDDRCAYVAAAAVPVAARIVSVATTPTSMADLTRFGRNKDLRWITVSLSMAIGDRKVTEKYMCFRNPDGDFRSFILPPE
jgi:hypothetical protein